MMFSKTGLSAASGAVRVFRNGGNRCRELSSVSGLYAREVLDSRGNPTVQVDLTTHDGTFSAIVPSGASTGAYEACELRDGGNRYMGKGVSKACANVNDVLHEVIKGMDVTDQEGIDNAMIEADGTPNKSKLGANAILGVSMAASIAGAAAKKVPLFQHFADISGNKENIFTLPTPCLNVINGGCHAGNKLAFQEFFMIPTGCDTFKEAMRISAECYHTLKKVIKERYGGDATLIGDEGGFAPPVDATQGLELLMAAIKIAGHDGKMVVGLDVAASEFKVAGKDLYDLDFKTPEPEKDPKALLSGEELLEYYKDLCAKFPIVTVEDPFDQDDWVNWSKFNNAMNGSIQIVGDDLTVTNMSKIQKAVDSNSCNALLLKVNQIGSISEAIGAVKLSKKNGWGVMTSHRSGETEDTTIADLAVGLCTGQIKAGAPARSERTAKYNRLLVIEELLAGNSTYAGPNFRTPSWMA